ncbi:O-antigen ligase family protein [Arthrobacter sp. KNU-44]|uniref:O-antigen ligase family protein n=1 Tax=Arthrobacter sp. KNU-44 TaxID=3450744 RepID=UPI003F4326F2
MVSTLINRVTPPAKAILPWTVPLAVLWMVTVDAFTGVGFGPVSLSGALTLGGAVICLFFAPVMFIARNGAMKPTQRSPIPLALTFFLLYAIARVLFDPTMAGIQNVAVLVTFILAIGLTAVSVTTANIARVGKWLRRSAALASVVAVISFLTGAHLYGSRTYALAAIVFLALMVPHRPKNALARFMPVLPFIGIALSLSRVALAIAAVLLMFVAVRKQRGPRLFFSILFLGGGAAAVLNWLIDNYQPLHDRFLETGDGALIVGGIAFNTSGRSALWETVLNSAMESPIFGKGAGSATDLVTAVYGSIAHPHNDYLRLLHDYGFVGLGLFCLGYLILIIRTFKRAVRSSEPMHWSAALGLAGVAVAMITDNVVIYPYAMIPLGVVVGASLALPAPPKPVKAPKERRQSATEIRILRDLERQERLARPRPEGTSRTFHQPSDRSGHDQTMPALSGTRSQRTPQQTMPRP